MRLGLIALGLGVLGIGTLFAWYARDLPTRVASKAPSLEATQILDREGNPLYAVYNEKRLSIASDQIPDIVTGDHRHGG